MGATQELQQKVCQRFGWSLVISRNDDNTWQANIVMGLGDANKRSFTTKDSYDDDKNGKNAVSAIVLEELAPEISARESLPAKELGHVFESTMANLEILDSKDANTWARFWNDRPSMVGIDTEGNQISPPVLVQIATEEYVILEVPRTTLSKDVERLLRDDSITKVFCDNFSHKDKICLGLPVDEEDRAAYKMPPIVDLESLSMDCLGPVKTARGLGRIVALTMPELQVRVEKPKLAMGQMKGRFANISRFALIEQGKAKPLRGLFDLKKKAQQYAALDAWCTLQVYQRMAKSVDENN